MNGTEGDRPEGLAGCYLGPQYRIAVLLRIGPQRPARVDHGDAERPEFALASGGERLVEDGASLGKRQ